MFVVLTKLFMGEAAGSASSRWYKPDSEWDVFSGARSILPRKWLAKMTKTRQNENENFQTMTNRDDS